MLIQGYINKMNIGKNRRTDRSTNRMNTKPADIDLGDIKADSIILRKAELLLNFLDKEKWAKSGTPENLEKAQNR